MYCTKLSTAAGVLESLRLTGGGGWKEDWDWGRAGVRRTRGFTGLLAAHWFVHLANYRLSGSFIMDHMPLTRPRGGDMPTG